MVIMKIRAILRTIYYKNPLNTLKNKKIYIRKKTLSKIPLKLT